MKRQELQAEFNRLNNQINLIKDEAGKARDELISLSCQQVCVSICGSLEQMLKEIFKEYARQRSGNQIYRPIEKVCESYQNPKSTKIIELVGLFDADFGEELKNQWNEGRDIEKQHLDNMVDKRITIAHRKKPHVDVSYSNLKDYFKAYKDILERIYDHFLRAGL